MVPLLLLMLLAPAPATAQPFDIKTGGTLSAEPAVVALIQNYTQHLMGWTTVSDRDQKRRPLVTPDYVYHDLNGSDIAFDALTERHKKNDLRVFDGRIYDAILYQYESSAILTYKCWTRGMDKGHPFEGYGSAALVLTKTADGWLVAADIMGQDPPDSAPTDAAR